MPAHMLRREFLENEAAQTADAATYRLELPEDGMLSALMLKITATNGATNNLNSMIKDAITRVEVIGNGSTVIHSYTGEELDRLTWRFLKKRGVELSSEDLDIVQFQTFMVPFGRFIGDKVYGLDLRKWNDVELRIQYNLVAPNAVGANGYVTGTFNVTVVSYRYPATANVIPRAYLRTTEFVQPTDAASGERRYEMPLQHKYVELALFVREDAIADDQDVTAIRIELDSGENRFYDANWDDLQQENTNEFGINGRQVKTVLRSDAATVDFETGIVRGAQLTPEHAAEGTADKENLLILESRAGDRLTLGYAELDLVSGSEAIVAQTVADTHLIAVDGDGVGNMVFIPFSREKDWSDALDSTMHGKIEVVLTSGFAGATLGLVLSELVTKQGA